MTEYDNDLLREGILRFKSKEFGEARRFFERALDTADDRETRLQAHLYLSRLTDNPLHKRMYLEEVLAVDMLNAEARRELAILDGRLKRDEIIDPDRLPAPRGGKEEVKADRFTCPKCGGRMIYSPDGASLYCEFCSRNENLSTLPGKIQHDFFIAMADGRGFRKTISVKTFQCGGCGATFLLPPKQLSASCAFCGSNHVLILQGQKDMVEPDAILPVTCSLEQAQAGLSRWRERMHIQPDASIQPPTGLFIPIWSFDISGSIPWTGKIMKDKREEPVSGEKTFNFTQLAIPATRIMRGPLEKQLAGFDLAEACNYDPRFLAGWPAEIPETSMSEASLDARQAAAEKLHLLIREKFGRVNDLNYSTSGMSVVAFRLILVPVWITQLSLQGQSGRVLINGRSGTVHSDFPGLEPGWLETLLEGGRLVGKKMAFQKKKGSG